MQLVGLVGLVLVAPIILTGVATGRRGLVIVVVIGHFGGVGLEMKLGAGRCRVVGVAGKYRLPFWD